MVPSITGEALELKGKKLESENSVWWANERYYVKCATSASITFCLILLKYFLSCSSKQRSFILVVHKNSSYYYARYG